MKIRSFAKINLGLEVVRKRPDGYHDIRTLYQSIDLWDGLEFFPRATSEVSLQGNDESIPWDANNLVFRAARLLQESAAVKSGMHIIVDKKIPAGRGLAGGSSNAAMTLYALNKLWGLKLTGPELAGLGSCLGADVAYFFTGGLCLGEERGDKITPLPDMPPLDCVLVLPSFPVSTAMIYGRLLPSSLTSEDKDSKIMRFLEAGEVGFLENRLEETIFSFYPQLKEIKSLFRDQGAELSLVTGSGSAVFGLFPDRKRAERSWREMSEHSVALLVKTVSRERGWRELDAGV
jgi:4-diphosphocytidyl-2-C-methyl-D-erythritol kinase